MKKAVGSLFSALLFLLLIASCSTRPSDEEVGALTDKLKGGQRPQFLSADKESEERWQTVHSLYERRHFHPIWIVRGTPLGSAEKLKQALNQAPLHGLKPEDYDTAPVADPVEHELRLSWALINFAFDVAPKDAAVGDLVAQAIERDSLPSLADNVAPKLAEYQGLRQALQKYRQSQTPAAPNDIHLIELNMARLRSLPSDLGKRYIRVNIPEYRLAVMEDNREVLSMNVVVGKAETATPAFSANMTHVVFSPYWNIPESILTKETLPKVLEDESYIDRQNIEIVRVGGGKREVVDPSEIEWSDVTAKSGYHFRQKPGAGNSLGLVKFMLPNPYDVYLHDTPADSLFKLAERDFSHGCVRLERPMDLAKYVLRDQPKWTEEKIKAAMHSGEETHVTLGEPLPVHLIYITAWPRPDGTVEFLKDVYNLDEGPNA
jgi:murein L,D-transpeptidase YcbB/YkuD